MKYPRSLSYQNILLSQVFTNIAKEIYQYFKQSFSKELVSNYLVYHF